jgi:hypothetical protein
VLDLERVLDWIDHLPRGQRWGRAQRDYIARAAPIDILDLAPRALVRTPATSP